ncbi:MAG: hypothetical protein L0211_24095 [Planctomycetaceae bacterium]|nr:hypothetical protein [Planctomycetaceae bacterium]
MITFVLGPFLLDLIESASGGRGRDQDPIAVTWVGGDVRDSELQLKKTTHQIAVNFLRVLISEVVERGGSPVVNGQVFSKETPPHEFIDPGIGGNSDEEMIVHTMLLAKKADQLGIVVDRQAAREFIQALSIPEVSDAEWPQILRNVSPEGMPISFDQLLDQIAFDLKARHANIISQAGLYSPAAPYFSLTPGQIWEYHNRLNRRFVIEAYPVDVAPFAAQVQEEPSEAELRELFEKGKSIDPDPSQAEPGFHKPHKLAFQWLRIDFTPFLEAAKHKVNDDEVAKKYESDIKQGRHKVTELPPDPTKPLDSAKSADPAAPTDPAKAADPAKATDPAKPAEPAKPDDAKPTENATDNPADNPAEKPAEGQTPKEPCGQEQPAAKPDDKPAEAKPADTKPVDPKPGETKPAETKPADTKPADTKPADTKPGEAPVAAPPTTAPPPKFKPYEEVKEEIRKELAQPIAQEAMNEAIEKAIAEVNAYGRKYRRWKDAQDAAQAGAKATKAEDPGAIDLDAIAAKYGFKSGSSKLADRHEIANYEIGQKVRQFDMAALQQLREFRELSFADLAYGGADVLYSPNPQPLNSVELDISYIYWRTDEQEAKEPTFEEAKKQVVDAWKLAKALDLAKADGQKLADKAKGAMSLKDVVPDPTKVTTTAPFSWLTTGSTAFQSRSPSLSAVPGIDLAGTEFMEGVFRLKPSEAGVAPNQSHRTVYVVRVVSQEPTDDVLREQFLESGGNREVMMVAQGEMMRTRYDLFEGLDKEMRLVWQRPPRRDER